MELDKTEGILHIATGDWQLVKELLEKFNAVHTSSKLRYHNSVELDGVLFSYLDAREANIDHIFLFGSMFGSKVRELRENGEINW